MQSNRWLQILIIQLVIIASAIMAGQALAILAQFSNIILLFFLSWLLSFMLTPVVRFLTRQGLSKTPVIALVYGVLALIFVLAGILLIPVVTEQIGLLITNFDTYRQQLETIVSDVQTTLQRDWGVEELEITQFYNNLASQAQSVALSVLQNTFTVLQSVAVLALQVVLVVIISFYFLSDGERIAQGVINILPPAWRDEVRLVALGISRSFGGFIRGQVIFGLVYALLTALVMVMPPFSLDFVVIASLVAGISMLIPLIGNFLAFVPPMLVCLITPDKVHLWPWLLLALFVAQSIMMNILGPRIMSSAIGIHPLYVMAALLIGGQIAGFWGALFGIPIAGAINLIGRPVMRRLRHQTPLYQEPESRPLTTTAFVTGPLAASFVDSVERAGQGSGVRGQGSVVVDAQMPAQATVSPVPAEPVLAGAASEPGMAAYAPAAQGARSTSPSLSMEDDLDDMDDVIIRRTPTLSARAWRLAVHVGARAFDWAKTRAQARAPRP